MWKPTSTGTLEWRGIVQALNPDEIGKERSNLEFHLSRTAWDQITRHWMRKGDSLYEREDSRILTDHVGVFLYHWGKSRRWHRFAGFAGFDRRIIGAAFDRVREIR